MTTTQGRKNLATKNQILRQQYNRLKDKKDEIAQHLSTIIRRCKQMQALKSTLRIDLQRATQVAKTQRNKKIAYINYLEGDIKKLEDDLLIQVTQLKKLQGQYQICLQDYDNVLKIVTEQIQACRIVQSDISLQKQNNASMKAMIFDYERLKRVLQQQRKYFKQSSSSEQKSHEERVRQLQKILQKLTTQQKTSQHQLKLKKIRAGLSRIHHLFRQRIKKYAEHFIRQELNFQKKKILSIKVFKNCMQLANLKHKLSTRKLFYRWHHNVFPKQIFRNLVQQAAKNDIQSKRKLSILNKMTQSLYDKNLAIFHLYQKGKYLSIISNKVIRKDLHYGFCKWRQNYKHKTQIYNNLSKLLFVTLPNSQKRSAFRKWKNNASIQTRLILANHLMTEYINTRQLSRIFRKWRFEVSHHELKAVNNFLYNMKLKFKIASRINYQKRKSKALTALAFRMTKIKLRNYFIKYWANVKSMAIQKERQNIQIQKNKFSQLRAQFKTVTAKTEDKNQKISLKVIRAFMMNSKLRPALKKWRNTMLFLRRRQQAVFHLALRRQAKTKIYVMNQFRKCVQFFQKKQMHQVLTDLNNKMQAINEKSTAFREKLKKCIEDLGLMASKKIDYLFNYSIMCQQRVYFNTDLRKNVKKLYKQYILHRFQLLMNLYGEKKGFDQLALYAKDKTKDITLQKAYKQFMKSKKKRDQQRAFYALRGMLKSNKSSFQRMGQAENIIMFYRMASAFVAIQRKNCAQKIKSINKKIVSNQAVLKTKVDNIENLEGQKQKLQESLKNIFIKFVGFEDRNMVLKEKRNTQMLVRRYFDKYRQNVQQKIYAQKVLIHFSEFVAQKNKMIFWKGANAIKYQNIIALTKQQLGKLNRKKKAFQQKNLKGTGDIKKRLQQAEVVHEQHLKYYNYYLKKFEDTLKFYEVTHHKRQKLYYTQSIFNAWKKEYQSAKRLALGINRILQRNLVYPGFTQIVKAYKKQQSQHKSQYLCAYILQRKAKLCMKDCLMLWRCNLRKLKCEKVQNDMNNMILSREDVAEQCKSKGALVAQERLRMKRKNTLATCFMAFKTQITEKIYQQRYKIKPFTEKNNQRILRTAMKGLKWLMFYKKTKRAYLKYKKQKFQKQLKADVFLSLKIYRDEHYKLVSKMQGAYNNIKNQFLRFALDKIINTGAYERDQLNYQRKKALRHLVMNKVTKVHLIKRKIMLKWHAWLIPRQHYLPNIMKNLQIRVLRSYFSNIKQHAYWNPIYIKKTADNVTSQGYSQINTSTNNLVKQGYDPQQIKQYLTKHNQKDITIIKQIINRLKVWGNRDKLIRAWNSWKQYIVLKSKIKKSLSKVLKIAQGLGRYWNRWKSKDPQFNAILQKQSRGNMLERYRDLGRLLKQYKRDVKDSKIYCQQLKQVNDQYAQKNDQGIKMALSSLSYNLKKGMKQGLQIWRNRVKEQKKIMIDQRYQQLSQGISLLTEQRNKLKYRLIAMRQQNIQMKQKCNLGKQCGQILEKLLRERDNLSIDLADKQHNLKLLLQDNLRLKQKIRSAKQNAQKLISKVQNLQNIQ